jgi:hypothetical protein
MELAAYHQSAFDLAALGAETRFPLPDEPFVDFWQRVAAASAEVGAWAALRDRLPQLAFPVRTGISQTDSYQAATRRGTPVAALPEATGLELAHPAALELELYASPAGRIPLLIVHRREEFVLLLQALARKNEPEPIPGAQGALMVSGYNNWCRIGEHRRRWEEQEPDARAKPTWDEEFQSLQTRKELYQDRFILLSHGPYSAVPAADLGLTEDEWRRASLRIRRDHECSHYLTRRLFGSMRNHLLDELMADYAGLRGALGRFRADWFLRFLGLEDFPRYREGGRLSLYRGTPPLGEAAFRILQDQVRRAALQVERFDATRPAGEKDPLDTAWVLAALAGFRLDELAQEGAAERLGERVRALRGRAPG